MTAVEAEILEEIKKEEEQKKEEVKFVDKSSRRRKKRRPKEEDSELWLTANRLYPSFIIKIWILMSLSKETSPQPSASKENACISGEEERENDEKMMSEYYNLYGQNEKVNQGEGAALNPMSEKDISNQIDKEMIDDKENDDLAWLFSFYLLI